MAALTCELWRVQRNEPESLYYGPQEVKWYYLVSQPVTTYSHSRLVAFENQSDTMKQPITLSSFLGTVFHLNLRDFYRKVQQGEILTTQELEQQFERLWHDTWVNETQWNSDQRPYTEEGTLSS